MATTLHSVCPLDCPDRCALEVQVEDGRVIALSGAAGPVTQGFICAKVRRYPERVYGADRLLHPMRRVGAKGEARFARISWDEALDSIAAKLAETRAQHGGEAILPFAYGGSNGPIAQGTVDERLFRNLGAARLERTVCAAQTGMATQALYGDMASVDFPDFAHARCILIWGANPKHSNIHLMPYLQRARAAGARVILIDPRDPLGPGWVDQHLAVRPGTDVVVALAMIHRLAATSRVDRGFLDAHSVGADKLLAAAAEWPAARAAAVAGVSAEALEQVADAYAAADPALIRCGWGIERNRNGEAAVAAVLALPAVAGKFGKPGGGYALSSSSAYRVSGDHLAGVPEAASRKINMSRLGRALLEADPPLRMLFVYDANPAVTLPDQNRVLRGLAREDLFTVVFDQVLTDTARWADIVLPATTFLEQTEVMGSYGTYAVQLAEPVIAAVGESKSNAEVFGLLARRLGFDPGPEGDALLEVALGAIQGPLAAAAGGRLEQLRKDRVLRFDFPAERPVQFVTSLPSTADGKVHLWPAELGPEPYAYRDPPDPGYPLSLISPSTDKSICSTLAEYGFTEALLEMHPEDAASRGLQDRQAVRIHNALGEVAVRLHLSKQLRPGVVCLPKGLWNRHTRNGSVGAALVADEVSPLSGGARFNDARVEVSPG